MAWLCPTVFCGQRYYCHKSLVQTLSHPWEDRAILASIWRGVKRKKTWLSHPCLTHSFLRLPQAVNAAKHGVVGVLVYTDPGDINDGRSLPNETFPNSWGLPPSGVERGSFFKYFGDPLTPYLPAFHSSFRLDLNNISGTPPIPAQPIGFQDAKDLLW